MFRHPKYYKELRKLRNKTDQAISARETADDARAPGQLRELLGDQAVMVRSRALRVCDRRGSRQP